MQDIDFDELDRAVNSVINQSSSSDSGTDAPVAATPKEEAKTPEVKPEVKSVEPALAVPERPAVSPAARRSSGRFMDVVHPSSDMRPQGAPKPAFIAAEEEKPAPTPAQPAETPAPSGSDFSWPDPIELAGVGEKEEEPIVAEPAPAPEPKAETAPLDSPFLPDAKVEKRPLGGTPPEPTLDLTAALKDLDDKVEEVKAEEPAPAPAPDPAPEPEAHSSVGAVDLSDLEISEEALIGSSETSDTSPASAPEAPAETPAPRPLTVPSDESVNKPLANGSIAQQYKEQPSTVDQPSGAIYDTEAYHQPLAHPPKKKTGLLIVLWILGLMVIGGGLGALLYFVVIPAL